MGFQKVITSILTKSIEDIARFDTALEDIKIQFEDKCPSEEEISKIINKKNQINKSLVQSKNQLNILTKTEKSLKISSTSLKAVVTTIKNLPLPLSAPPGVGLPASVLTNLSSTLDLVGDKVKQGDGSLDVIPEISKSINSQIESIETKIKSIDELLLSCLEEKINSLSGLEKEEFLDNLNISTNPDGGLNEQLKPNSTDSINYKGFDIIIENDDLNTFDFLRRRVKATKGKIVLVGDFSYSISTNVLVEEIKFEIDKLQD